MDRDESPIGGIEKPPPPSEELYKVTIVMDLLAILLSFFISPYFSLAVIIYIAASKAYSWRGIRLKKFPFAGFLTVIIFQGALIYFITRHVSSVSRTLTIPYLPMMASALLVGSFYPLTQIYQHKEDRKDGVTTISMILGYKGTFIFSASCFLASNILLAYYFISNLELDRFFMIQTWLLPVLVYFFWWAYNVWRDTSRASYKNAMLMNIIASVCTNGAFITLFIIERL